MAMNVRIKEHLRNFLLQRMCAGKSEAISRRINERPKFAALVRRVENQLIDDFLDDKLTLQENALFRERFLKSGDALNLALKRVGDRQEKKLETKIIR